MCHVGLEKYSANFYLNFFFFFSSSNTYIWIRFWNRIRQKKACIRIRKLWKKFNGCETLKKVLHSYGTVPNNCKKIFIFVNPLIVLFCRGVDRSRGPGPVAADGQQAVGQPQGHRPHQESLVLPHKERRRRSTTRPRTKAHPSGGPALDTRHSGNNHSGEQSCQSGCVF